VVDPSHNTVRTFDGTLTQLGQSTHEISIGRNGEIDVKLTALSNADALVELGYAQGNCNNAAILNAGYRQVNAIGVGGLVTRGTHCVIIRDSLGTLRATASYTLRVSHP
jgi:hypothetical protein